MSKTRRFIVAWDFPRKPSGTFYRVLNDAFGNSHPSRDFEFVTLTINLPKRQAYWRKVCESRSKKEGYNRETGNNASCNAKKNYQFRKRG